MNKKDLKRGRNAKKPAKTEQIGEAEGKGSRKISSRLAFVLIAVVAVAFLIYSLVSLANINSQRNELRQELNALTEDIRNEDLKIEEMRKTYNQSEEELSKYIEQKARDVLDYVKEGERIFEIVAGD